MDWGYTLLIAGFFSFLLIFSQRLVERHRRGFRIFILLLAIILLLRGNLITESWVGYFIALFMSALYWLLIGRYNPVNEDDNIKVYGLDD